MTLSLRGCWCGLACTMAATYARILVWKLGKPTFDLHLTQHSFVNFHLLLCGVFLARISSSHGFRGLLPLTVRGQRVTLGGLLALVLLLGTLAVSASWKERVPVKVGMLLPLQALLAHSLSSSDDLVGRLCRWTPLQRLGTATYAMAILQDPVATELMRRWVGNWHSFDLEAFCFIIAPAYAAIGVFCTYAVEPSAALSLRWFGRQLLSVLKHTQGMRLT
eukprot:UN1322